MHPNDTCQSIAERLYREGICRTPLDSHSLSLIEQYLGIPDPSSDLRRRLSNVEINFAQLDDLAEKSRQSSAFAVQSIIILFRNLTDNWRRNGLLQDFIFTFTDEECDLLRFTFSSTLEKMRYHSARITENLMLLGEYSAQIRACSAGATEIFGEARLAMYAAALDSNTEGFSECRATSLLAHASASECTRKASSYLGVARSCTSAISVINKVITEVTIALRIDEDPSRKINVISPSRAAIALSGAITALENINFDTNK